MDTRLFVVFILSAILGAVVVITGCIKVLGKNGELNMKTAGFILAGFIFVALPVLGTVSIEWGEFKILVNTTNRQVKELQQNLDSLKTANNQLQGELNRLQSTFSRYQKIATVPHIGSNQKAELARSIEEQINHMQKKVGVVNASLDSAVNKSSVIKKDLRKFESERWYMKP